MGLSLPGSLSAALGFVGGGFTFPEGDEDALMEMGRAYDSAAFALRAAGVEVGRGSADLQQVIEGEVHLAMKKYFDDIAGPDGLAGVAENFSKCGTLCDLTAMSVLVAKEAYIATLALFAVELIAALAASPLTFGASMGVATAEGVITGVALRMIIRELIENITRHIVETGLTALARKAAVEIAKGAAIGAATGAGKELIEEVIASGFFGAGVDPKRIAIAGGEGAVSEGASAGAEGVLKGGLHGPAARHGDGGRSGNGGGSGHGSGSDGDTGAGGHPPRDPGQGGATSPPLPAHPTSSSGISGHAPGGAVPPPPRGGRESTSTRTGPSTPPVASPRSGDPSGGGAPRPVAGTQPDTSTPPRATASPGSSGTGASEASPQARSQNSAAPRTEVDSPEDVLAAAGGARFGEQVDGAFGDDPPVSPGDSTLPSPGVTSAAMAEAVIRDRGYETPVSPGDQWSGRDLDPGIRVTPPAVRDHMGEAGQPISVDNFSDYTETTEEPRVDLPRPLVMPYGMTTLPPSLNMDTADDPDRSST